MSEPVACPFCNSLNVGLAQIAKLSRHICVQCGDCEGSGPWRLSEEEAIAAWNQRTTPVLSDEQIADLWREHSPYPGGYMTFARAILAATKQGADKE